MDYRDIKLANYLMEHKIHNLSKKIDILYGENMRLKREIYDIDNYMRMCDNNRSQELKCEELYKRILEFVSNN